jgi:hypothetical protein
MSEGRTNNYRLLVPDRPRSPEIPFLDRLVNGLWNKVEEISEKKKTTQAEIDRIYEDLQSYSDVEVNQDPALKEKRERYNQLLQNQDELASEENIVQNYLLRLEEDTKNTDTLTVIADFLSIEPPKQTPERKKVPHTPPTNYDADGGYLYDELVHPADQNKNGIGRKNPTHPTTGRRATNVKGNMDPLNAPDIFFNATADTHGGKVRKPKKKGK